MCISFVWTSLFYFFSLFFQFYNFTFFQYSTNFSVLPFLLYQKLFFNSISLFSLYWFYHVSHILTLFFLFPSFTFLLSHFCKFFLSTNFSVLRFLLYQKLFFNTFSLFSCYWFHYVLHNLTFFLLFLSVSSSLISLSLCSTQSGNFQNVKIKIKLSVLF